MGYSPVVMIAGTGTGKTIAIILPASSISGGTTIVIVLLYTLQGNLQKRCKKAQISSVIWNSQRPYNSISIVFVTPESAVTKTFARFMNWLQEIY
jgi:superfamily II DNA helicase RecQ